MKVRAAALTFAAALSVSFASQAAACTPASGWPDDVILDPQTVAARLVSSAASIDIAVVDKVDEDFDFALKARRRDMLRPPSGMSAEEVRELYAQLASEWDEEAGRLHYRVVKRLKGSGSEQFTLSGVVPPQAIRAAQRVGPRGSNRFEGESDLHWLKYWLDVRDLKTWPYAQACDRPVLGWPGGTFLVFRDAQGNLLRQDVPISLNGSGLVQGPVHVPVASVDDPWAALVQTTIEAEARNRDRRFATAVLMVLAIAALTAAATLIRGRRPPR